jgi:hypothetical protein
LDLINHYSIANGLSKYQEEPCKEHVKLQVQSWRRRDPTLAKLIESNEKKKERMISIEFDSFYLFLFKSITNLVHSTWIIVCITVKKIKPNERERREGND